MQKEDTWIHTTCGMCEGSCGVLVHRVDGIVVNIKGDPDCPNSNGKICSKGTAAIMSLYDPYRVTTPLRRTNPEKGLGVDPKWVPIPWEEALDVLEERLTKVRKEDPRKLAVCTFDTWAMTHTLVPWCLAFGTPNVWAVYFCGQYLHSATYLTNGTFHCDFDADYCNYLMLFGNQAGFGVGLNPNITAQKVAAARKRGMKVVAVDPICNHAASKADEWVPIRPGTDAALTLAMINVLLNELGIYDREFIKRYTNGPYLVKPDGFYMRQDGKPLVWDVVEGKAKPYNANVEDYAIEGSYLVNGAECKPAFLLLREHVERYTPEMAAEITTVPATTIRRLAEEFGKAARIGSTITVDGVELPYRPVAVNIYRGAGAHKHGIAVSLALQLLNLVVGAFYVPGSHRGLNCIGPSWSWAPGEVDGLVFPGLVGKSLSLSHDYYHAEVKVPETMGLHELYPLAGEWSANFVLTSIHPEKYKLPYEPEVLITCRRNLFRGGFNYKLTAEALKKYKFVASFCTHLDEMAEFADLVLPECVSMEKLVDFPSSWNWSHTGQTGYWYWGITQPVLPPAGEARDWMGVMMDLADRMGFIGDVYKVLNLTYNLKEPYRLDPSRKYTHEEICDRRFKSQFGEEKGLEWFKKNGYLSAKRSVDEQYPLPWLKVRFPIYFENFIEPGFRVKEVTQAMGLDDWDVADYKPLPNWKPCDSYTVSGSFDLKAVNFRIPTHSQGFTDQNPWLSEVAELNPYAQKILINAQTAKRKGIKDKDKICVESAVGKVIGEAKVTECIHPEVVGICSSFGSLARGKPVAYGKGVSINSLLPGDTDPLTTGVDACVKVKVRKA